MKRIVMCFVILSSISILGYSATEKAAGDLVVFNDENFEQCVATGLSLEPGTITEGDMQSLRSLTCYNQGISDISGIEYADSLISLSLNRNNLTDISELAALESLTRLSLANNQISDISALTNLKDIYYLDLNYNQIVDLSPLIYNTALKELYLNNNQISSLDSLEPLTTLTRLEVMNNQISDISALSSLINMQILRLTNNQVTDLSPLSKLTDMETLEITGNQITSLSGVENMLNLKYLYASDNYLTSLVELTDHSLLEQLNVDNNQLNSLNGIESALNLNYLSANSNQITDLRPLKNHQLLTVLDVSNNQLTDLTPVADMPLLVNLYFDNNNVADISCVSELVSLVEINAANNQISDISSLAEKADLKMVDISGNHVSDLRPLSGRKSDTKVEAQNQTVEFDDVQIKQPKTMSFQVFDVDGMTVTLSENISTVGVNEIELDWDISSTSSYSNFSGIIYQTVTLISPSSLTAYPEAEIEEETILTDKELIELFNVSNSNGERITVDQTQVNYSKPGSYKIIFSDESENEKTSTLIISDVLPQLTMNKSHIAIQRDDKINYLYAFGVNASELYTGDLNNHIIIDDSKVDISKVGSYPIKFSVTDEEDNKITQSGTVNVKYENISGDINTSGSIEIYAVDKFGVGLPGYEYTIYDEDGNVVGVIVTDENGHAELNGLKPGEYTVVLTNVPQTEESIDENLSPPTTDNLSLEKNFESGSGYRLVVGDETSYLRQVNSEIIAKNVNDEESSDKIDSEEEDEELSSSKSNTFNLSLVVVDEEGTTQSGIEFELINVAGEIISAVSDENGEVLFENIEPGLYTLKTKPHQEYKLKKQYELDIGENGISEGTANYVVVSKVSKSIWYILLVIVMLGLGIVLKRVKR